MLPKRWAKHLPEHDVARFVDVFIQLQHRLPARGSGSFGFGDNSECDCIGEIWALLLHKFCEGWEWGIRSFQGQPVEFNREIISQILPSDQNLGKLEGRLHVVRRQKDAYKHLWGQWAKLSRARCLMP